MRKILFLVLFAILFISGCKQDTTIVDEGPFIGGKGALSLEFVEGAPISEFFSSDSVPVKVLLTNNGEYNIPEDTIEVKLYGLAMEDYGLTSDYQKVSSGLKGIEKDFSDEGGEIIVDMGTINYQREGGVVEANLLSKVCYPYHSEASITACASSREIETSGEMVCDYRGEKYGDTRVSSSPVKVTSFTEQLSGKNDVAFKIVIENVGSGSVFMDDSVCSDLDNSLFKAEKENKVYVRILPEEINCAFYGGEEGNEGYIKLDEKSDTLTCSMPVENTGASYEREISISLDFKYTESKVTQLTVLES